MPLQIVLKLPAILPMHLMQVLLESKIDHGVAQADGQELLARLAAPAGSDLPHPRILFVLAHPDDEVLAVGGRLERMTHSHLITVTDGAPQSGDDARHHGYASLAAYRAARQNELLAALAHAGLDASFVLAFPSQVPDQAASHHLVALTRAIADAIERLRPDAVLTHPYEGGHPDHDACAFAARHAVQLAATRAPGPPSPLLVEAPFYNVGDNGAMRTGRFLQETTGSSVCAVLSDAEAQRKRERLALFASQAETLAQFSTDREQFRIAPTYDFTKPPHEGKLLYEHFSWGLTGPQFRKLATDALDQLFPGRSPYAAREASGT